MPDIKDILKRLKTLRQEAGVSQGALAFRLGIGRSTYVRKEQGAIPITTDEWLGLAEALGKDPAYFFASQAPRAEGLLDYREAALLTLYRALRPEEKRDMIAAVVLLLKAIKRKEVAQAVERLRKN